jgi:hypothetical protein
MYMENQEFLNSSKLDDFMASTLDELRHLLETFEEQVRCALAPPRARAKRAQN